MTLLVFTDLDGSLLEHESYSIEPARPALASLRQRGFMVIMNSSKTGAEIQRIQHELGLSAPYICENGAALENLDAAIAQDGRVEFGTPLSQWLATVHELRANANYNFEGFSDWTPERLCELSGLKPEEAGLAKQRRYSEPVLWHDSVDARNRFQQQLASHNLQLIEGGRFHSIQGKHNKANAMYWLRQHFPDAEEVITVGLGDSPNDSAMLNAADVAVIIKSSKSDRIELHGPQHVIRTRLPGPAGWQQAITEILQLHDGDKLRPSRKTQPEDQTHG